MITTVCIALFILLLLTRYFHSRKKCEFKDLHEIPCPDGLPLIGNVTEIFWNQYDLWKISRKRALECYPIYRLKMLNKNIVCLLDPEDIKMILGEAEGSNKGPFYDPFRKLSGNGLVVNNGKLWKGRRKLLSKCFSFSTNSNSMNIFNKEIKSMIFDLQKKLDQCVDISYYVQNMTFKSINGTILGSKSRITDEESRNYIEEMTIVSKVTFLKATKPHINLIWPFMEAKKKEDEALAKMQEYISSAVKKTSTTEIEKERDHLNMLDLIQSAPQLFDSVAVRNEIDTFIFAGQDTTSTALSFILMALANYPQHQETIYREIKTIISENGYPSHADITSMDFLDRFIKECLRLYPPLVMIERILTKEMITKTGYRLPIGTMVWFQILDIHRNPNLFTEPEKFDPDRFLMENVSKRHLFSYIPFSAGPRICIARKYALLQIKSSICGLLQHFKLEPGTLIGNIKFFPDVILKIEGGIEVKLRKR